MTEHQNATPGVGGDEDVACEEPGDRQIHELGERGLYGMHGSGETKKHFSTFSRTAIQSSIRPISMGLASIGVHLKSLGVGLFQVPV